MLCTPGLPVAPRLPIPQGLAKGLAYLWPQVSWGFKEELCQMHYTQMGSVNPGSSPGLCGPYRTSLASSGPSEDDAGLFLSPQAASAFASHGLSPLNISSCLESCRCGGSLTLQETAACTGPGRFAASFQT